MLINLSNLNLRLGVFALLVLLLAPLPSLAAAPRIPGGG